MIGDGILPGDRVLLRPDVEVRSGEIAAVQIAGDGSFEDGSLCATLKHVVFDAWPPSQEHGGPGRAEEEGSGELQGITLRASNPKYGDLRVAASRVSIAGVYRGLVRSLD